MGVNHGGDVGPRMVEGEVQGHLAGGLHPPFEQPSFQVHHRDIFRLHSFVLHAAGRESHAPAGPDAQVAPRPGDKAPLKHSFAEDHYL